MNECLRPRNACFVLAFSWLFVTFPGNHLRPHWLQHWTNINARRKRTRTTSESRETSKEKSQDANHSRSLCHYHCSSYHSHCNQILASDVRLLHCPLTLLIIVKVLFRAYCSLFVTNCLWEVVKSVANYRLGSRLSNSTRVCLRKIMLWQGRIIAMECCSNVMSWQCTVIASQC